MSNESLLGHFRTTLSLFFKTMPVLNQLYENEFDLHVNKN